MTDIVHRLAQWAENDMPAEDVALAAKHEIERLRAALKEIRDAGPMTLEDQRWRIALSVLGGEND